MYGFFQERNASALPENAVPAGAARFPPPLEGGGRAQTTAPSGLGEKGRCISGIFRSCIVPNPCIPVTRLKCPSMPYMVKRAAPRLSIVFQRSEASMPHTAETEAEFPNPWKTPKNFPPQPPSFQRLKIKMKKNPKKLHQKACRTGKRVYFCTRNNGEVLKI